jgi:transcription-repair coupling factor (superfamily II helicase)
VEGLLDVVGLRVAARELGIERVEVGGGRAVLTFAASTTVTPSLMLKTIAASRGALKLRKEYTVEARIPAEPWPAVCDAVAKLLDSLR